MRAICLTFLLTGLLCWVCPGGLVAAAGLDSNQVTRAASFSAASALASFQVEPGLKIELVAAEPLVTAPVAMAFDENGRLFVAEMPGNPDQLGGRGRIRVLDDADEQGQFHTSTVFADDVRLPSALACYAGGVFVASGPDLIYLKDTTGDGVADVRRTVLSGFGGTNELRLRAMPNNFNWGLNGRIHAATAGSGGSITSSNLEGAGLEIGDGDFSFNPRTLAVVPESGPAQSGLSFDNFGRKFVSDFARPLRGEIYEKRYWARNPYFAPAPDLADIASPATAVFRPWNNSGARTPDARTNGLILSWLTNAQGLAIYRGNALPASYVQNAFICDPSAPGVHRLVVNEKGLGFAATRPPNESKSEFLLSKDEAFHPVQAINGPDGCLYIVDRQDGIEHGRIYRVQASTLKLSKPNRLAGNRTFDLVSMLASPNGWQRDTAARLLFERQDPAAVPLLATMASNSVSSIARLHAVFALASMAALKEGPVLKLMQDTNANVRQTALMLSELVMPNGVVSDALWNRLKTLVNDPSPRVRCQLAFTVGAARRPDKPLVLAHLLSRDPTNEWFQTAVFSSLGEGAGTMFRLLGNDNRFRNDPLGMLLLQRLGEMIGAKGVIGDVNEVIDFITHVRLQPLEAYRLTAALGEGLYRTRSSLALVDPQGVLAPVYASALSVAIDGTIAEFMRIEAMRLVDVSPYTFAETSDWLLMLCNPHPLGALRSAAIQTLGRYDDPRVATSFFERWSAFSPILRRQAVMAILSRSNRVPLLLQAIEQGVISKVDLPSNALNLLRTYPDPILAQRATRLLGPVPLRRPDLMEQFKSALKSRGAPDHGRELFIARCSGCHQMGNSGQLLGPDLAGVRAFGKEKILSSILEPNATVASEYSTAVLATEEGQLVIGTRIAESPASVVMRSPGAAPSVWPRVNVRAVVPQRWSLMPDGLEQGLSPRDMGDLLEYLMTGK